MQQTKPFQYKRAIIDCSCGNNGRIVTEFFGVNIAKLSLQIAKNHTFNPVWIEQTKTGHLDGLDEKGLIMQEHLKLGHKLKVISC